MQLVPKQNKAQSKAESSLSSQNKITLDVEGMKCAGCVRAVEKQITQFPGVNNACVNLATGVAVLDSQEFTIDVDALAKELTKAGFPSTPRTATVKTNSAQAIKAAEDKKQQEMQSARRQLIISVLLLVLSGIGHLSNASGLMIPVLHNIWLHFALATVAILIPGRSILIDGWLGLRRNAPNMNTLVGLGTISAYIASVVALAFPRLGWECFFDEPVMILGFILLGRTLEKRARNRAAAAFKDLLSLRPNVARLIAKTDNNNSTQTTEIIEIPAEQVRIGESLQVLLGDKIPVDGEVLEGKTAVDESMLTGESALVPKQIGDSVSAGTINQSGTIVIQTTRTGDDTTLAHIVNLVEAAQTRKAPVQKLADTVAGYFTYGVLTTALITFLFWYFIGTHIWQDIATSAVINSSHSIHLSGLPASETVITHSPILISLKLAIAVMVVACPCALGLATPTAILVGTGIGAERGLLIKGGDVLEKVHQLKTIVFDKTGTLTTGNPTVTDCIPLSDKDKITANSLIQLAAAVESGSQHPLAKAILEQALKQQLPIPTATDFHTEPGFGVSAVVENTTILLGSKEWLNLNGIEIDHIVEKQIQTLAQAGKTVVGVATNGEITGLIAIQDTLRNDAKTTVEQLRSQGLRVMLLSGDTQEAALAIAKQLGLENRDTYYGIPPAKKAAVIQSLQNNNPESLVAMVGDGINDAPALSQADVGISLNSATDVAMEAAEIVLMRDKLTDVVAAISLSRGTFNKIRQNLFWAFAYNIIGIPLAAGVLLPSLGFVLNPGGAAALMAFSSVSVVTNSLLLRNWQ